MAAVDERSELFGAAILLYLAAGVATGVLIVAIGFADGRGGGPGARRWPPRPGAGRWPSRPITAVGLPVTVGRDAMRAAGLYTRAAATEIGAVAVYAAVMLALALSDASAGPLIGASGLLPLIGGLIALAVARASGVLPGAYLGAPRPGARLRRPAAHRRRPVRRRGGQPVHLRLRAA